jgi:hypothetical protein
MIVVVVYVDDIIFGNNLTTLRKEFATKMKEDFEMSMLGVLRFGYLRKWSPCAYESLSTKGEDYYPCTLLYDSNFTLT